MKNFKNLLISFSLAVTALFVTSILPSETNAQQCSGTSHWATACAPSSTGDCVSTSTVSTPCYFNTQRQACSADIQNSICAWVNTSRGRECALVRGDSPVAVVNCGDGPGDDDGGGGDGPFCMQDCHQETECRDQGNCGGGIVGDRCGSKPDGTPKFMCTRRVCTNVCITLTPPPATPTPRVPTTTPVAYCQNIRAYNTSWAALTSTQLGQLQPGNRVYFCSSGYAAGVTGSFTAVRYQINGVMTAQSTTQRPGSTVDRCYLYTVPQNTLSFNIMGQMLHSTLGWVW